MNIETIVRKVKSALRISTNNEGILEEVRDVVVECIEDLKRSGAPINLDDPLILKACKCYAKAFFGYDENSTKYEESYIQIKRDLAVRSGYSSNG